MVLKNVTMILFDRIFKGDIRIKGSHISEIEENLVENEKEEVLDLEGKLLIPGFIDVHIHGADGADAMDGSIESLQKISKYLASKGTTNFLATTLTSSKEMLKKSSFLYWRSTKSGNGGSQYFWGSYGRTLF
ncbi:hypothetical protein HMPREF9466_01232 [Fusobacterium necrophorum subsp. funduliforme 1_1_36S]|nr:hypothetical protein HMPREF9466_01232 [Fusobacterium necrophorum subsp. funduliforme 1_1_36S]